MTDTEGSEQDQGRVFEDPKKTKEAVENELGLDARRGDVEGLALGFAEAMLNGVTVDKNKFFDLISEAYHTRATTSNREASDLVDDPKFRDSPLAGYLGRKAMASAEKDFANVRRYQAKKQVAHDLNSGSR